MHENKKTKEKIRKINAKEKVEKLKKLHKGKINIKTKENIR